MIRTRLGADAGVPMTLVAEPAIVPYTV